MGYVTLVSLNIKASTVPGHWKEDCPCISLSSRLYKHSGSKARHFT